MLCVRGSLNLIFATLLQTTVDGSPYLTIEFKDEETLATARHQVAVASAIAPYNRYRLKSCAL